MMFTPDRNGTPEMMQELIEGVRKELRDRNIKFQPFALIMKPFRRANQEQQQQPARPVAIRRITS